MRTRRTPKVTRTDSPTASKRRAVRKTEFDRRRTKPETAYDLCEMVAQHIEEEPLRYDQGQWGFEGAVHKNMPACGTVCCRAGWIVALHDGAEVVRGCQVNVSERSDLILGLGFEETCSIYYDSESLEAFAQGTKEYAETGAAGLRRWANLHAAHLKARLLKDVPKLEAK